MSKTALVVDDSPTMRQMVAFTLTNAGFTVVEAENGKDAVSKVADGSKMDIVVTDLNMPEMDGIEATKQIRSHEIQFKPGTRVPILALTANVMNEFKQKCLGAGMDDFLTKPIKRDLVFEALQTWSRPKK